MFEIGIGTLEIGILFGIDKFETDVERIGFGIESVVTTFVGDTREFMTLLGNGSFTPTVQQTSARACNWVVFTSGIWFWAIEEVVVVLVCVVRLMHVLIDGKIGMIGITENR